LTTLKAHSDQLFGLETSLKPYNTFGLDAHCSGLYHIYSAKDFIEFLHKELTPFRIIGGGSNILLTGDINGYIVKNEIKGIHIEEENDETIQVRVGSGEIWHQFVMWSLSHRLYGLENLSLIPGTVGAAPMQNIGAYGIEQEHVFHSLNAIEIATGKIVNFSKEVCMFGYRESIFKNTHKDKYFITDVTYCLYKKPQRLHIAYGAIAETLQMKHISNPTSSDISEVVIEIRKSKLPDPKIIGNAGSFFKNPVIDINHYKSLKIQYPDIPSYPVSESAVKVPAGWLIEQLGFKGIIRENIGVHKKQALVLVNYGNGSGRDIWNLAMEIQNKVREVFSIDIAPEVNIW